MEFAAYLLSKAIEQYRKDQPQQAKIYKDKYNAFYREHLVVWLPSFVETLSASLTSGLGFLGIISSALIYTLPRVPAWNNLGSVTFFLMTSIILGTLVTAFLGRKVLASAEMKQLLNIALGSVMVSAILYLLYFSLLQATPEGAATAQYLLTSPVFLLRAAIGWIIPIFLINAVLKKENPQPQIILFALTCGVAGELLGRGLFYVSAVGMHITALM